MGDFCLQSRRTGMFVVRQYDGRVLTFKSRPRAWIFKIRRMKWHWRVVPYTRVTSPAGTVRTVQAPPPAGDNLPDS